MPAVRTKPLPRSPRVTLVATLLLAVLLAPFGAPAGSADILGLASDVVCYNPGGKSYHSEECRFAGDESVRVRVEEARGRGLSACRFCKPPE